MGRYQANVTTGPPSKSPGTSIQNTVNRETEILYTPPPEPHTNSRNLKPTSYSSFVNGFLNGKWIANIDPVATEIAPSPERRALVIAISYGIRFPPTPLRGTFTDAYRIVELLISKFGYPEHEICVLADVEDELGDIDPGRNPSRDNIELGLTWLCKGSRAGDHRFLFFAGHGTGRTEKDGLTYEGIIPVDVKFKTYRQCADCTCGANYECFTLPTGLPVTAHPGKVIWSQTINDILARHLADGALLTAVFDCEAGCRPMRDPSSSFKDSFIDPNIRGSRNFPSLNPTKLPPNPFQTPGHTKQEQASIPLGGNMICLPIRVDMRDQGVTSRSLSLRPKYLGGLLDVSPEIIETVAPEQSSSLGELACTPYILDFKVQPFGPKCNVICWAACEWGQHAFEDHDSGGHFTTVFTELLQNKLRPTYRDLNSKIDERFNEWNSKMGPQQQQNPQFYISSNLVEETSGDNKIFDALVDV